MNITDPRLAGALDAIRRTVKAVNEEAPHLCGTCTGRRLILNPNSGQPETCPACHGAGVR